MYGMGAAERWEKDGVVCELHYDETSVYSDPRQFDNIGIFVCREHQSYDLPQEQEGFRLDDYESLEQAVESLRTDYGARNIHPVWMYDHSQVTFAIGDENPFHCEWDSSLCGIIYTTDKQIEYLGAPSDDESINNSLKAEIEEYSSWAEGDVYYFDIVYPDGEHDDDCYGGLLGFDYAREEAESQFNIAVDHWHWKSNKESAEREYWEARDVMTIGA